MHPLVELLISSRDDDSDIIQENRHLNEESILFLQNYNDFKVLGISNDEGENIKDWGHVILKVADHLGYNDKRLKTIANDCINGEINSLEELHLQLERRINRPIYKWLIAVILLGLAIMAIMRFFL